MRKIAKYLMTTVGLLGTITLIRRMISQDDRSDINHPSHSNPMESQTPDAAVTSPTTSDPQSLQIEDLDSADKTVDDNTSNDSIADVVISPAEEQIAPSTTIDRVGKIYRMTALLTFNTALFLAGLLFVVGLIMPEQLPLEERRQSTATNFGAVGVNHFYSESFNRNSYQLMGDVDIERLWFEYDSLAAEGHWQVHPWTGLTLRPFAGVFLNVDEEGRRLTLPPNILFQDQAPLTVWAFGGSTLFGWGLADDFTLPSMLQAALQEQYPNRQVRVINFANPWYYSAHEMTLFAASLRDTPPPDIAIFLDGLNEVQYVMRERTQIPLIPPLATAWENQIAPLTRPNEQSWITFNPSFPPNRIKQSLRDEVEQVGAVTVGRFVTTRFIPESDAERMDVVIDEYRDNRRMITAIAEEFDVRPYFLLQPLTFWRDDPNYVLLAENLADNQDNPYYYDLTNVFDDADPAIPMLVDRTHYSDSATQILAEQIAALIIETYEAQTT